MPGVNILQWVVTGINNQGRDEFIYNSHPISSHYPPALLLKCQMKHFKEQHCSTLHLKQLFIPVRDISLELINACAHCSALPLMQNQRQKFCKVIKPSLFSPPHQRKFRVMSELSQWALAEKAEVEK